MPRPDLVALAFVLGLGCGIGLCLLCIWLGQREAAVKPPQPAQALPGVMVLDSTMGEFDAVRRGS